MTFITIHRPLLALVATALIHFVIASAASAQQYDPPQLCPEEGPCELVLPDPDPDPDPPTPGTPPGQVASLFATNAPFDLNADRTAIEAVWASRTAPQWAVPPTITRTQVLGPAADCNALRSELARSGTHVVAANANYGGCSITIDTDDVWLEMSDQTSIDSLNITGRNVRVTGGNIRNDLGGRDTTDIHIENVNAYDSGNLSFSRVTRLTVVNNTWEAADYMHIPIGGGMLRDLIYVGNEFKAQTANRCSPACNASTVMVGVSNALFGYNCLSNRLDERQRTWRFRAETEDILMLKNILTGRHSGNAVGGMIENVAGGRVGHVRNIRYDGNHTYDDRNANSAFMQLQQDSATHEMVDIVFANNTVHSGGPGAWYVMTSRIGTLRYDDSDNNTYINHGSSFQYPSCPYGADH